MFWSVHAPARPGGPGRRGPSGTYASKALGITVGNLTAEVAEQLGYEGFSGVVITQVDPQGMAARVGLSEGALVMQVGQTKVKNIDEFAAAVEKTSIQRGVMLLVRTGGGNRFIVLRSR